MLTGLLTIIAIGAVWRLLNVHRDIWPGDEGLEDDEFEQGQAQAKEYTEVR